MLDVKAGDKVGRCIYGDINSMCAIYVVVKVTATEAILDSGVRVIRKSGEARGSTDSSGYRVRYCALTDGEVRIWEDAQAWKEEVVTLNRMNWYTLTRDQVSQVTRLLKSFKSECETTCPPLPKRG